MKNRSQTGAATAPRNYRPAADLLAGRNILVSGAGRGIGRTAALVYAAHGARTILLGRKPENLEQTAGQIAADGYPRALVHPLDLADAGSEQYEALYERLQQECGTLHCLLHNAALLGEQTPLMQADLNLWRQTLEVNLNSGLVLSQSLFPLLEAAEDASIIFTSSGLGLRGRAYWGAYCVSKFAVEGLAQVLAEELEHASSVRVNVIDPGVVDTRMRRQAFPAENPQQNPQPEQIMGTYLYLAGPDSRQVHGQRLLAQVAKK